MKIFEIIMESGMLPIAQEPSAAMQNPTTFPGLNMNAGSLYTNYGFQLALAGAPDYPTKADNWIAGDPLLSPYTEVEMEMINMAAEQVGAGNKQVWSGKRSQEISNVQKVSPVLACGPVTLKSKK
jgi:hypothetical protein